MTVGTSEQNPYKRLCELAGAEASFDQRLHDAVEIGRRQFGVGRGAVGAIDGDQYLVVKSVSQATADDPDWQTAVDLAETWCRHTIDHGEPFGFADVEESPYRTDIARDRTGQHWYLGAPIVVDGELFGTLSFSNPTARSEPLSADDREFVSVLADWIGTELATQHELTALRERNERLDEFAQLVAHDLRNPLAGAIGFTELTQEQVTGQPAEWLEYVLESLDRMDEMITENLALAKEGVTIADREPCELSSVVTNAWASVETRAATLTVETDQTVVADERRLQRVFENLFRNAIEHGGPDVSVTVSDHDDGFTVSNDGPPLPDAVAAAIAGDDIDRLKSFGLGLLIVTRILDAHGWELAVRNSADAVTFVVTGVSVAESDRSLVSK